MLKAELALRLARLVATVVSAGFAFGGFVGIVNAGDGPAAKAVAFALLAALLVLHLRNCVRRADGARPGGWRWTLAAQGLLTAAGMVWFADTWYGNSGFLAAAILLLIRRQVWAWIGFALVLVAQFGVGLQVRPTPGEAFYLAVGHAAFVGIALYVIARLADVAADLHVTRTRLAVGEVALERAVFARQLDERVGRSVEQFVRDGESVLHADEPAAMREKLAGSLGTVRAALNEARSVAHGHWQAAGAAVRRPVTDDLTTTAVAALGVITICLMIVPVEVRRVLRADLSTADMVLFVVALAAFVGLYLRNCVPGRDGRRPAGWRWTLAAQAVVALAPLLVFDFALWHVVYLLPGLPLVLLRGWLRWVVTVPLVCLDAILAAWGLQLGDPTVLGQVYEIVWAGERALIVFGLVRMAELMLELRAARVDLARVEVGRERLRFGRDLHDLLGYRFSVMVLKIELVFRLLGRDAERARSELAGALDAGRQALADIKSVAAGQDVVSFAAEAEASREVLGAAGVEVGGSIEPVSLPAEVDLVLATVVREGVTNVLRHSQARHCMLDFKTLDRAVRLRLTNDGVPDRGTAWPAPGMGIESLTRRVRESGGELATYTEGGTFRLVATIPLEPSLVGGDPDGVHSVPGVQLGDRRREIVAHSSPAEK